MKKSKKLLSIFLSIMMVLSMLPSFGLTAYADSVTWNENQTIETTQEISGGVTVGSDITVTVSSGVVLTVNGGINANDKTVTVKGTGTLIINGATGSNGVDGNSATDGEAGGDGFAGNIIVDGATVTVTGGTGGIGGYDGTAGWYGGSGGNGVVGNVTVNSGSIEVTGGTGGNGRDGLDDGGDGGNGGIGVKGTVTVTGGSATLAGGTGGNGGHCYDADGENGGKGEAVSGTITGLAEESDDNINWAAVSGSTSTKQYVRFTPAHTHDDITFTAWTSTNSLPSNEGSYYLTADVELEEAWNVYGTINLCLDGHTITCAEGKEITPINVVGTDTVLNLYDKEDNSGTITGGYSTAGGVQIYYESTFNMYGGTITGNTSIDHGGGVRAFANSTFNMYGGSIENNKTKNQGGFGGGVHIEGGTTFNMYGGIIKDNTASSAGGVFIGTNCTFNLSGGSITGNATTGGQGGGVLFTNDGTATFKLSGDVTISYNVTKIDIDEIDVHETHPSNMVIPDSVTIEVVDALTGEGKIYVQIGTSRVFTNSTGSVKAKDYIDKFVSDSATYRIRTEGDELKIEAPYLRVGGTFVYDDNAADVFKDGKVKFTPANETTTYATLTLNGYQYDGTADDDSDGIIYLDPAQLRIVLKGENVVKATNPGIMINREADTIISSENGGSLEVVSKIGDAIYANGSLAFDSGTITATGYNRGIAANGIFFNGGRIVATGTGERGYGIYCEKLPWAPDNSVSINSGISSLIASGTLGAVYGDVANALEGLGWSNITGTDGQETIAVTAEARSLGYKKVAFVSHTHSFTYSASGATITATCSADDCTLTDSKATLTIAAPDNLTYDKSAKAAVITDANGIQGTAKVQYQTKNGSTYGEATETAPTNAGTYKASITVGGATASVEYTIAKADPICTAPTGLTATYGQTLADVTLTNPSGNTAGTWAWSDSQTSVGNFGTNTFKASFVPTDTTNYNTKTNIDVSVTVGKANITPTVSIEGWTYGQEANAPSVSGNSGNGAVTYTYATKGSDSFSATVPTNAGNYTVKATVAATTNYNGGTATADFTIAKANITPTVSIDGWTYNQTAKTPSVSGNSGNGAVTYTYATKGSDSFSATVPTNAGNYTVKATIAATANYNGATATADFTIAKADPTYTAPTGVTATYGDTLADIALPTGWAWVDGTTSVGDAGTNTFKATYTPTDTANYNTVTNIDVTVTVGKADPEYTVPEDLTAFCGETLGDVILPEGWTWVDDEATSVGDAGTNTFKATYTPADTDNYNIIENVDVDIVVTEKTVTINLDANGGVTGAAWMDSFEIPVKDFEIGSLINPPAVLITAAEGYEFNGLEVNGVKVAVGETPDIPEGTETVNVKFLWKATKVGWVEEENGWSYYEDGELVTGWMQLDRGQWYYFDENGVAATGWKQIDGEWYYFNICAMQTGWRFLDGKWYYLNSNGKMATGWVKDGGKWYYMNKHGVMQTGWVKDGGKWYYMDSHGAMQTGWVKDGGKWYYLNTDGSMRTADLTYKGKVYHFDKTGACTNP